MTTFSLEMHTLACQVRIHAYAPYSQFQVGVCLRTPDNQFFVGCNVENAAYGDTQCAEASAIGQLISQGYRSIAEILIVANGTKLCSPCGSCRQKLIEFADSSTLVHLSDLMGIKQTLTLGELLPLSFSNHTFLES